ncbi:MULTISPECIES: HlyD family type I secretion periplasmic adaptor subunit [unclassified Endozoicomonas]|uniref:HlyD family type I secretion periplasmic adaptor subunit n=1 Tax=unclassified Endozoicomonas TaxID=2644528 RepID=UPI0021478AAF|nr:MULTISPECIES: HlyD family type I secretion periplasmic adaptor subunit [unclassified Endozoicomonas]
MSLSRLKGKSFTQADLDFITDASQGELMRTPSAARVTLWILFAMVLFLLLWAYFANINEIVRGQGKAIPISRTQVIQNLEGGTIKAIHVREGQSVMQGELLMELDPTVASGSLTQSVVETSSLLAEETRLAAEVAGTRPEFAPEQVATHNTFIDTQLKLYKVRQDELHMQLDNIYLKTSKARQELVSAQQQAEDQQRQVDLIRQQLKMNEPLLKMGAVSESAVIDIKQRLSQAQSEVNKTNNQIPKLKAEIQRLKKEEGSTLSGFRAEAQEQLSEVRTRLGIARGKKTVNEASVQNTELHSPVDGVIQKLYVTTIGGVAKPGAELIDIVPVDDELMVEVKVKPKDIGFVQHGQHAKVKISAFDFAVYGGLDGRVQTISADSITDQHGNSYYIVKVRVEKAYFGEGNSHLNIIPGMQATVDISVAERSVLQYIMKPLLRALQ